LDLGLFLAGIGLTLLSQSTWLEFLGSVVAGLAVGSTLELAHAAAHGSLVARPLVNEVLARVLFFPSLHSTTMWKLEHHRFHHMATNVANDNGWTPFSKAEFDRLSPFRRGLERFYRCGVAYGIYYIVNRLIPVTLVPRRNITGGFGLKAWSDFALVCLAAGVWLVAIYHLSGGESGTTLLPATLRAFVVPLVVGHTLIGWSAFAQHTNPSLRWYRNRGTAADGGKETTALHMLMPGWYDFLSHHAMDHLAHHVLPVIPPYHLRAAQKALLELLGSRAVSIRFSIGYFVDTLRRCKLYDYDRHVWLDFEGKPTTSA
jgi:omega-6 fatty acid desaturase (delta-12 desaturase)